MDNHNEKNTEWIIAGNPDKYDVVGAFRELGTIDWTQSSNINVGDIVYIYVSNTVRAIRFKCKVNVVNKVTPTIDDSKFNISGDFDGTKGRYMELEVLKEFSTDLFGKNALELHGFKSPMGPMRVPAEVKEYLDIVQQLLNAKEMDPDSHDATYELLREVVKSYKKVGDLAQCDYKDLNLVYLICVGTWKQRLDAKKKTVRESHLPDDEKKRLEDLLDTVWIRAQNGEYTNNEGNDTNFGMFGTGFYTFQGKTDDKSPRDFIQMCIDIMDMDDDDEIFDRCGQTLNNNFHGMRAASASMVLHCLKPMTFPIFNSNMGADNIYVYFNTGIKKKTEIYEYINNVKIVKAFRDQHFKVKNYRIFDMAAWNIGKARSHTNIDYLGVLDYLDNNRELPYKNPETAGLDALKKERLLGIKARGQAAVAEMKKMAELCKEKYGLDRCEPMAWLDGSNTKTRKYLWAQLKYSKYANNPISISIFAEISPQLNKARYRFSLEIKNDGTDKKQMEMYHSYLDMPLQPESSLVYVVGSNELGKPDTVEETADEIKNKIQNGTYKKVQICRVEEWTSDTTNDYMENTMLEAVGELIPYYKHVIGDEEIEYYPNISEYDPGITAEEYERILSDENIVKCAWLDTLHYLYLMGGIGTCKQIANKYGNGAAHYNTDAINVAKAVHKETNCPLCARDTGENQYWPVLFYGRDLADSADGVFSYKMREPLMEAIKALEERGVFQEMKEANKEFDKNLILYGPPGTGKTYNSATYAVAICDGKSVDELTDYDAVMTRYNELKKAGRIAFTTFHQSYGYEEFIEGIKPIIDENKQDIGYTIESGVFKEFCENAKSIVRTKNGDSIDAGARIWKLTIMNGDLNQVKQECFEENNVRMGFDIDSDEARSFVEDVRLGDIILSFKTRKTIDGIAIVTDEAAVLQDKSMYKTARAVKWLAKNIDEDITDINNSKLLHRMTFAKVPNMNVKDVIKLAEKVNPGLESTVIEENTEPHVFIIDEINRGNISKIFGELITLIESTKRAGMSESASAILPYSGDEFSVPSNVYILGTMNTADRSIALMDTALRRRFQFIEMMPDSDVLRKIHADKVEDLDVAAVLDKINERITFLYDREHTIGHAFFTGLKDDATLAKLQSIFEKSVIPLLQEYFYEDYQKIQLVLGDNAKTDDNLKFIVDEKVVAKNIFKGNVEDVIDLPEKRYSINKAAFGNINSYKEIL